MDSAAGYYLIEAMRYMGNDIMKNKDMNDCISIIVPIYNVELYLEKCLLSIQRQTYDNLEIILIDDGSTDRSGFICDEFVRNDKRFKVIHQKNGGLANARNRGLKEVAGEFLGFVDGDDYIESEMFEELYKAAKKTDSDITMCAYRRVGEERKIYIPDKNELEKQEALKELLKDKMITSVVFNKLFKKKLFEGIKFPEGKQFEDTAVMHLLFQKMNKLYIIHKIFYNYQFRPDSITAKSKGKGAKDRIDALEKRCNDLKNTPFYNIAKRNQMKVIRNIMCDMIATNSIQTVYYKQLHVILEKMIEAGDILKKGDVLTTKLLLKYPVLYFKLRAFKRNLSLRRFNILLFAIF